MNGADVALMLGRSAGLVAAGMLMFQFVLSARLKWLDRAFGLDRLLRWHAMAGATAAVLALLHPVLIYGSGLRMVGELRWGVWSEALGAATLILIALVVATSVWGAFLMLSYETWRRIHQLTFVIVVAALVHGLALGSGLALSWARAIAIALGAGYVGLFVWVKIIKPARLARRRWTVSAVRPLAANITQVELAPPEGVAFDHRPGQFVFVRFRGHAVRAEQHPFTISSAPAGGAIGLSIKACGDFTQTIDRLAVGDTATVEGPYGRFSYELRSRAGAELVMVAGGIGITPFLSMLRRMAAVADGRPVTLVWACRTEAELFCRAELVGLAETLPGLRRYIVLSRQDDWPGETGHIDEAMLQRLLTDVDRQARAFLCGPAGMMKAGTKALRRLGFRGDRIHDEKFSL